MTEFLKGTLIVAVYLIVMGVSMLLIRKFTGVGDELFRKILHFVLLGAYIPLLFGFSVWWHCLIFVVCLGVLLYPVLLLAGKIPGFSSFVNERKKGEFRGSMILAIGVMAFSIVIGWGVLQDKYVVIASVYSWGVGDAFAALIGKRFGKHKITLRFVDNKKSIEGSLAMLITSCIAVFAVLLIRGGINPLLALAISLLASAASTFVELCSKNGLDTIFCPAVSMVIILPMVTLLGG